MFVALWDCHESSMHVGKRLTWSLGRRKLPVKQTDFSLQLLKVSVNELIAIWECGFHVLSKKNILNNRTPARRSCRYKYSSSTHLTKLVVNFYSHLSVIRTSEVHFLF